MSTKKDHPNPSISEQTQTAIANAITIAVQIASAFKLYSFRIISHEDYVNRVRSIVSDYQKTEYDLSNDPDYVFDGQSNPNE